MLSENRALDCWRKWKTESLLNVDDVFGYSSFMYCLKLLKTKNVVLQPTRFPLIKIKNKGSDVLTVVTGSRAWTVIVVTIFIIYREATWCMALYVQVICRGEGCLGGDIELEKRRKYSCYDSSSRGILTEETQTHRSPLFTLAEFLSLIKNMWISLQFGSETIPLTA